MNRRTLMIGMAAMVPMGTMARQSPPTAVDWLLGAIQAGDPVGIEDHVTAWAEVPSDIVVGIDEFGWWIVELNARLNQKFTDYSLNVEAQFSDDDWHLAYLDVPVVNRESGNDSAHPWYIAAQLKDGKIDVLNIAYWV